MRRQVRNGADAGLQMTAWQHLGLIENNHAVGNIVELPALGRSIGVERFKELHRCGDNHRRVPVLAGQALKEIGPACLFLLIQADAAVVLHHIVLPQNGSKNFRILLNDGGIGNYVDDPVQPVLHRMLQGEGKGGHRFPSSGGNREGIHPPGLGRGAQTLLQNFTAAAVQLCLWREPTSDMRIESLQQHRHGVIAITTPGMI